MAVDTREKRFSMLNFGDGTTIHTLPEADGAIDLDDRQHLLDCYSGNSFGAPPDAPTGFPLDADRVRAHRQQRLPSSLNF